MSSKKWVITLISITMVIVIAFGALQFYLDPLLQYGGERGPLTYRTYTELYCNPGIAKNYDYNAVLLGSSMVENTDVSELDKLFGCTTIKVPYSGGSTFNHKTILDVCYDSGHQVEKVFWALDEYALTTGKNTPRFPLPEYLYDNTKINDLSYLLNFDIFYYYTLFDISGTIKNQNQIMMRDGSWEADESIYCKGNALSSISYPMTQKENKGDSFFENNLLDNLEYNILPLIKAHPETEFHFYMAPYSILSWYIEKCAGTLDAQIYDVQTALGKIFEYDNTNVHFFQNNEEIITNLDLYKDYTHFKPEINSWMTNEMYSHTYDLTKESYITVLDNFHNYLTEFDYDAFISGMIE